MIFSLVWMENSTHDGQTPNLSSHLTDVEMQPVVHCVPLAASAVIDKSSSSPSLLRAVASTGAAVCWHSLQASLKEPNCLHGSKTSLISLGRASTSLLQKTECTCIPHLQQKWFPRVAFAGAVQRCLAAHSMELTMVWCERWVTWWVYEWTSWKVHQWSSWQWFSWWVNRFLQMGL